MSATSVGRPIMGQSEPTTVGRVSDRETPTAGARAPAFHLADRNGVKHRLSEFKGRPVFVYFYPKAMTGGCTTQAKALRDSAGEVGDTVVVGISPDPPERLGEFDDKHDLDFLLLSDPDHKAADAYGAWGPKVLYGRRYEGIIRSAFLVDKAGKVAAAWPKITPKSTTDQLLKALGEHFE